MNKTERWRPAAAGVALVVGAAASGCGLAESPEVPRLEGLETLNVACVNITGLPEKFTASSCQEMAGQVDYSLKEFSASTGGRIETPQVNAEFIPGYSLSIDDAQRTRCLNIKDPANRETISGMVDTIMNSVLAERDPDPRTGFYVVVNAPVSQCGPERKPAGTNEENPCIKSEALSGPSSVPRYAAAAALVNSQRSSVFHFAGPAPWSLQERSTVLHEMLHNGWNEQGPIGLGHEIGLCLADNTPGHVITDATTFREGSSYPRSSLMDQSPPATNEAVESYLAVPHAIEIGVVDQSRVVTPTTSQTVELDTVGGDGPAAVLLPLEAKGLRGFIDAYAIQSNLTVDRASSDYALYIGRAPGENGGSVRVYAGPKHGKQRAGLPLFTLADLTKSGDSYAYLNDRDDHPKAGFKVTLNGAPSKGGPAVVTLHMDR